MGDESPTQMPQSDVQARSSARSRGLFAAIAVAAAAAGLIAFKELRARPGALEHAAAPVPAAGASVLLFADPDEAGQSCGCGEIIRLVRKAATRGVAVREVAPGSDVALEREHRVTVAPTVLIVDPAGRETARWEGEEADTIEAIRAGLDGLDKADR